MELFGQVMVDMGYDFGRVAPDWYDVLRPTTLLDGKGQEYYPKGNYFMGVRQTSFGIRNHFPTQKGELHTWFEFELFGTGQDAGQTTFRLKHAFAEWGKLLVGQSNSVFMDIDVFPNSLEYWGPNAMVFYRNIQLRYTPVKTERATWAMALERPGATADQGQYGRYFRYADLLDRIQFRFPLPDLSMEYRRNLAWGYVELAGILRYVRWENPPGYNSIYDLDGQTFGWGLNLSTNVRWGDHLTYRGSLTVGEGIQNYMDDADADIGVHRQYENPDNPIKGVAIPMLGFISFLDIKWNEKFSSSIGYSRIKNKTVNSQLSTAFLSGDYALVNLICYPVRNVMAGVELQYGSRTNNDFSGDPVFNLPAQQGASASNVKIQASVKYSFDQKIYKR